MTKLTIAICTLIISINNLYACDFILSFTKENVLCNGESNGSATLNIQGNVGPYYIKWSTGDEDVYTIDNLHANTYFVEVTDKYGCTKLDLVEITEPDPVSVEATITDALCFGDATGKIVLTASGGSSTDYQYNWSNSANTSNNEGLYAGTYTVTVKDDNLCSVNASYDVGEPEIITVENRISNVTCPEGNNGEILSYPDGGTAPYTYYWSTGDESRNLFDLSATVYTRTVKDKNLCEHIEEITIIEPDSITITKEVEPATCYEIPDGSIQLTVEGGTTPYSYIWSDSKTVLAEESSFADSLSSEIYHVTVVDANNCTEKDSATIEEPQLLISNITPIHVNCYGDSTGSADFSVSGGNLPYTYLWNTGDKTSKIENIPAGTYSVVVVDSLGCTGNASINIYEGDLITANFDVEEISCRDQTDGIISTIVEGGYPPYQIDWSTEEQNIYYLDSLSEGSYSIEITDDSSCTVSYSVYMPKSTSTCLSIPNAFSPNDDDINDTWVITNAEVYENFEVQVINSWGGIIFTSKGNYEPWDGTKNGKKVPMGTYYYHINTNTGEEYNGNLTVLR